MAVSQLLVKIAADIGGLKTGVSAATSQLDKLAQAVSGVGTRLETMFPGNFGSSAKSVATGVSGIVGSIGKLHGAIGGLAIGALITDFVNTTSSLTDLSAQTDISVKDLQRFKYAGDLVGLSLEQMVGAIGKLQDRLGSLDPSALSAIAEIGLDIDTVLSMNVAARFEAIATAIAKMEDPARRSALQIDLLGRGALPLLRLKDGLKAAGDQAEHLGLILSEKAVKGGEKFGDTLTMLKWAGKRLVSDALAPLMDHLQKLDTEFQHAKKVADVIDSWTGAITRLRDEMHTLQVLGGHLSTIRAEDIKPPTSKELTALATKELPSMTGTAELSKDLDRQIAAQQQATKAANAYREAITALRNELSGAALQTDVKKLQDAFAGLTAEQRKSPAVMDRVGEAARKLRDEGARLGPTLFTIAARTEDLSEANFENEQALRSQLTALRDNLTEHRTALTLFPAFVDKVDNLTGAYRRLQDTLSEAASQGGGPFVTTQQEIRGVLDIAEERIRAQERAVVDLVDALGFLASQSTGTFGDLLKDVSNIADAWLTAADAVKQYGAATTLAGKFGALLQGAGAVAQATSSKDRGRSVAGGAIAGAQAGLALAGATAGVSIAVGAAAGAIVGFIRTANQGRKAVEAFADSLGGFDALHTSLGELGVEGERLWVSLTQGVGNGNPKQAEAAILAITEALAEQKKKHVDVAIAAEDSAARVQAAQEAAFEPLKNRIQELGEEYDKLFKSIESEAPEEVMGVIEQQTRERMAVIAMEREATTAELTRLTDEAALGFADLVTDAEHSAKGIEDAFARIEIPPIKVSYDYGGGPALNLPGAGADPHRVTAPVGVEAPEPGDRITEVYLDGHVLARSVAKDLPGVLQLHGVR